MISTSNASNKVGRELRTVVEQMDVNFELENGEEFSGTIENITGVVTNEKEYEVDTGDECIYLYLQTLRENRPDKPNKYHAYAVKEDGSEETLINFES